jgi:HlyD family secretion protein
MGGEPQEARLLIPPIGPFKSGVWKNKTMKPSVFRKSSLERLSSPEQLDQLMRVTTPKGWLVFLGLMVLVVVAVVWGIFGRIAVTVEGKGILMKSGGIMTVQSIAAGVIQEISVWPGDIVRQGEVVARLSRFDLKNRINETRVRLEELERQKDKERRYREQEVELQRIYLQQEEAAVVASIRSDGEQLEFMEKKAADFEKMARTGAVSRQQLVDIYTQRDSLKHKVAVSENRLKEIQRKRVEISRMMLIEETSAEAGIEETRRTLRVLEQQFRMESEMTSPYTGRVVELLVNEGTFVEAGTAVVSLEPVDGSEAELQAVIYVTSEGSNLKPGMEAQISPAGVKKEEFGFIRGTIVRVSDFPASPQGMMRVLGNENLVRSITAMGPVIEVTVDLVASEQSPSGFAWSSPRGPTVTVRSGTICTATLVEKHQRPLYFVIPWIRKATGM